MENQPNINHLVKCRCNISDEVTDISIHKNSCMYKHMITQVPLFNWKKMESSEYTDILLKWYNEAIGIFIIPISVFINVDSTDYLIVNNDSTHPQEQAKTITYLHEDEGIFLNKTYYAPYTRYIVFVQGSYTKLCQKICNGDTLTPEVVTNLVKKKIRRLMDIFIINYNITVIRTINRQDTIERVINIVNRVNKSFTRDADFHIYNGISPIQLFIPYTFSKQTIKQIECFARQLACIPCISYKKAKILAKVFHSWSELVMCLTELDEATFIEHINKFMLSVVYNKFKHGIGHKTYIKLKTYIL